MLRQLDALSSIVDTSHMWLFTVNFIFIIIKQNSKPSSSVSQHEPEIKCSHTHCISAHEHFHYLKVLFDSAGLDMEAGVSKICYSVKSQRVNILGFVGHAGLYLDYSTLLL